MVKIPTTKSMLSKENLSNIRAARLVSFRSPLKLSMMRLPPLGPHDVAVKIYFAGINFYELMVMDGVYPTLPPLPVTPGGELAGEVVATGSVVRSFRKGDRVFSLAQTGKGTTGSYAEIAHVNERYLYPLPETVSFETGAVIAMTGFASYAMLRARVRVPKEGVVLIHSAAGGVGSMLVQLVRALAPKVTIVGTCSSKQKAAIARSLGADMVIVGARGLGAQRVRSAVPKGIDIIFDSMGQQYLDAHLSLLRPMSGILCSYGAYTGPITDAALVAKLRRNNLTLSGFLMWPMLENKPWCTDIFAEVFALLKKRTIKPIIDRVFSLDHAREAIARLRQRKNIGKVLLTMT